MLDVIGLLDVVTSAINFGSFGRGRGVIGFGGLGITVFDDGVVASPTGVTGFVDFASTCFDRGVFPPLGRLVVDAEAGEGKILEGLEETLRALCIVLAGIVFSEGDCRNDISLESGAANLGVDN